MKLNYFSLNTTLLGLSRLNNNVVKRRNTTVIPPSPSRPEGLIGQYKPYLNSNDSPTRSTLKDYSGLGNDIILYNFLYALGSGYGLYKADLNAGKTYNNTSGTDVQILERTSSKLIIKEIKMTSRGCIYTYNSTSDGSLSPTNRECPSYKVKISNLPENTLEYQYISEDGLQRLDFKLHEGINVLPKSYAYIGNRPYINHGFNILSTAQTGECNIIIEQIPDYPGALVSDGVDDFGLCEKTFGEVGTIIVMLDDVNWANGKYLYNSGSDDNRIYCLKNGNGDIQNGMPVTSNTSKDKFNVFVRDVTIVGDTFCICAKGSTFGHSSTAIYAIELYNRKLTDEEIEGVKEAMYTEYQDAVKDLQNHIIADWECYDKTNEDEDRNVLKDSTGHGHDIQLYNIGYAEGSGYGKYAYNFASSNWIVAEDRANIRRKRQSINVTSVLSQTVQFYMNSKAGSSPYTVPSFKIKVTGLTNGQNLDYRNYTHVIINITNDGVYTIPSFEFEANGKWYGFVFNKIQESCNVTIEQIPEHKGALVSDGIDDFGLCENFPILNKEDGYTVLAIRKWLNTETTNNLIFLSNSERWTDGLLGAFNIERIQPTSKECVVFGNTNPITDVFNTENIFMFQTNNNYQNKKLTNIGSNPGQSIITLFCGDKANKIWKSSIVFYRAMILNKNCSIEEIKFLAKQMIARHKEKTGETITLNI